MKQLLIILSLLTVTSLGLTVQVQAADCLSPEETYTGMQINQDTVLCSGYHDFSQPLVYEAINVIADNITLSCQENTVLGGGGNGNQIGLRLRNRQGVTVRNCVFAGFNTGISVHDSDNISLLDNHFYGRTSISMAGSGMILLDTNNSRVINNYINNSGQEDMMGIVLTRGDNNRLESNHIIGNYGPLYRGHGIVFYSENTSDNPENNWVVNNFLENNRGDGILIVGPNNHVIGNRIDNSLITSCLHSEGIHIENYADFTEIRGNTIINSCEDGITVSNSKNTKIYDNRIENSGRLSAKYTNGIDIQDSYCDNTEIINNIILNNRYAGIYLGSNANGALIKNNIIQGNDYGLKFSGSYNNIVEDSRIENSGQKDILQTNIPRNRGNTIIGTFFTTSFIYDGYLDVYHKIKVQVWDQYPQLVPGAMVKVSNNLGQILYTGITNQDGSTNYQKFFLGRETKEGKIQYQLKIEAQKDRMYGVKFPVNSAPIDTINVIMNNYNLKRPALFDSLQLQDSQQLKSNLIIDL